MYSLVVKAPIHLYLIIVIFYRKEYHINLNQEMINHCCQLYCLQSNQEMHASMIQPL
ncbi:unnamed protein product [Schistosoma curassoni]|uniref:Uncharacterized protein n=1 Tax=Schistosoma curassoni TaxID=6186 RepID=A0A183K4G9_9TREM|nr:unnamed protein product [Schistosoma curassoni]